MDKDNSDDEDSRDVLYIITHTESSGLNLQKLGDTMIVRPLDLDTWLQLAGRLDRPGQRSSTLWRIVVFTPGTHEAIHVCDLDRDPLVQPTAKLDAESIVRETIQGREPNKPARGIVRVAVVEDLGMNVGSRPFPERAETVWTRPKEQMRTVIPGKDLPVVPAAEDVGVCITNETVAIASGILASRDPFLESAFNIVGTPRELGAMCYGFNTLAIGVLHQQVSVKSGSNMKQKLLGLSADLTGNKLDIFRALTKLKETHKSTNATADVLRETCGMSRNKARTILEIHAKFKDGSMSDELMRTGSDEDIRKSIMSVRGKGPWSTEMFLLFHNQRLSARPMTSGDVALMAACKLVYGFRGSHEELHSVYSWIERSWGGYSGVVALYLFMVADMKRQAALLLPSSRFCYT